jgi:YHS domain-containing protein/thiol-disulfide isomerase/thioredoxin
MRIMGKLRGLLLAVIAAITLPNTVQADQTIHWEFAIESAKRAAAQSNRNVLIVFSASWCQACRAMENEVFNQPEVIAAVDANYVPVKINVEYFPLTAKQYGVRVLPTTVILSPGPQGQVLASIPERVAAAQYVLRLNEVTAGTKRTAVYAQIPAASQAGVPPGAPTATTMASPPNAAPAMPMPPSGPIGVVQSPPRPPTEPQQAMQSPVAAGTMWPPGPVYQPANPPAPSPPPNQPAFGLEGYCPVQLAEKEVWSPGDQRWGAVHRGRTYLFVGPEQRERFLRDPDHYAPIGSGDDIVWLVDHGRSVPGTRNHGVFYLGKVFLFSDETTLAKFRSNPKHYAEAALKAMTQPDHPLTFLRPAG